MTDLEALIKQVKIEQVQSKYQSDGTRMAQVKEDLAKLKKNVEKIKDLYVEKGFYMAEVTYEVKRDTSSTVDVGMPWPPCVGPCSSSRSSAPRPAPITLRAARPSLTMSSLARSP